MANIYNSNPLILDTDIASYRTAASASFGIKPSKIVLIVGGGATSSAGTVIVTRPSDSVQIYPPISVSASLPENYIVVADDLGSKALLNWNDFAVSGLTATGTRLFVFFNI